MCPWNVLHMLFKYQVILQQIITLYSYFVHQFFYNTCIRRMKHLKQSFIKKALPSLNSDSFCLKGNGITQVPISYFDQVVIHQQNILLK